ncbi:amidohydrolase family protein [Salinimonas sp. HHU 13199]|uniref:Amidohydrolase family protein n=1 Tax=Salinimonas profundi TaxID=2729140 RepID=A0ABR8LLZ7_9ALTE|nr:amidohydrolase family protein [Salinimonas profundi]MBD3585956.1 amidohydrolase family protein [Salinimonas profundi]
MHRLIDSHVHLFDLKTGDYHWLRPENPPHWGDKSFINRSFSQQDISVTDPVTLSGIVHIEAGYDNRRPWREIDYLEQAVSLPLRTVAGADITSTSFSDTLDKLAAFKSVCGIRHILDDQAVSVLGHSLTANNMQYLADSDWHFEAQFSASDSRATQALLRLLNTTGARCIINHAGIIPGETVNTLKWRENLQLLAQSPNVAIKASGWEMMGATRQWRVAQVAEIVDTLITLFGVPRVMLASNFPLCLFTCNYGTYWQQMTGCLPLAHLKALLYENSVNWYRFNQ